MRIKHCVIILIMVFCLISLLSCYEVEKESNPFQKEWDVVAQTLKDENENNYIVSGKGHGENYITVGISIENQPDIDSCIEKMMNILANKDEILAYVMYGGTLKNGMIDLIVLRINLLSETGEVIESMNLYGDREYGFQVYVRGGIKPGTWILGDEGVYDLKDYRTVTQIDSDGDGLSDKYEIGFGLDPNNPETEPGHNDAHMAGPHYWTI